MRSPSYNKLVFIDFGLSQFVKEDEGIKTLTKFVGSVNYCSEEMRKCFTSKKTMNIDLYFNDLYALDGSLEELDEEEEVS